MCTYGTHSVIISFAFHSRKNFPTIEINNGPLIIEVISIIIILTINENDSEIFEESYLESDSHNSGVQLKVNSFSIANHSLGNPDLLGDPVDLLSGVLLLLDSVVGNGEKKSTDVIVAVRDSDWSTGVDLVPNHRL